MNNEFPSSEKADTRMEALKESPSRPEPFAILSHALPAKLFTRINEETQYSFYGPFDSSHLCVSACEYIISNSDANANRNALVQALQRFLAVAAEDCRAAATDACIIQACWLDVRMFTVTDRWVTPRWHRDGRMFDCSCVGSEPAVPHSKYAVSLLGPSTRVLAPTAYVDDVLDQLDDVLDQRGNSSSYEEYAAKLAVCEQMKLETGQIIRFSWGQKDSPVHSEPDNSTGDRVFISVLFGSEKEIRVMCKLRDVKYETLRA